MYTKNNPTTQLDGRAAHCPSCGSFCDINTDLDENDYCNDCRPKTAKESLEDILQKFEKGPFRYDNDPAFRIYIECLVKGIGVYAVLDSALKAGKVMQDLNLKYIEEINQLKLKLQAYENPKP